MLVSSRIFVLIAFSVIGAAFLALPAALIYEFGGPNPLDPAAPWIAIATLYSHHFLFFASIMDVLVHVRYLHHFVRTRRA
jgi:hypothetical protein